MNESGTGMVGSVVGVTAFLTLLFFAAQLVLNLYATSTVTAAAFDGARIVAGADGGPAAEVDAERHIRELVGGESDSLTMSWAYLDTDGEPGPDVVTLTVEADHPTHLFASLSLPFQHITRTVRVRMERVR